MGARIAKAKQVTRNPAALVKNVEKVLEEKQVSPRHPSTVKAFDDLVKSRPEFEETAKQKNENLHFRLESVRVDSTGAAPSDVLKSGKRTRKLNIQPEGKLNKAQLENLFLNKKIDPQTWTADKTAEEFKLDIEVAKNLLEHFGAFYIIKTEHTAMTVGSGKSFLKADEDDDRNLR